MSCPCGSQRPFDDCCGPALAGTARPATAESLMRSRYTAYVRADVDYLMNTLAPASRKGTDRNETARWARDSTWLGLEVVATERGGESDDEGIVEFRARYRVKQQEVVHHERSTFRRIDGAWYYVDGASVKPPPIVRTAPKVGRNDPCPCGSGKKHKKCCGAAA